MAPAREFWEDFRARATLHPQLAPERQASRVIYRWAWAGASAMVVVALSVLPIAYYGRSGEASTIQSLEIGVQHSAVVILDDKPTKSTILWIVDMETDPTNGGNT